MSGARVLIDGGPARGRRGLARYAKELAFQLSHAPDPRLAIDMLVPAGASAELAPRLGPGLRLLERPWRGFLLWQAGLRRLAAGYDLFHGLDNGLPPGLPRRLATVATVHDLSFLDHGLQPTLRNRLGNRWRANRFAALRRGGAAVITGSRHTAAQVRARGLPVACVAPPPLGMMLSTESCRPKKLGDRPYLLIAGGASGYKRTGFAADALAPLAAAEGLGLVAFGLPHLPGAQVLPGLADAEVAYLYRHAAGVVFPSVREGFGLPTVEAVGFGAPVLAAALAPMTELSLPGLRFFAPDDAEDLRRLTREMLGAARPVGGAQAVAAFYAAHPRVTDLYAEMVA